MSWTAYCKKCGKDVPVGEQCPECGAKLTGSNVRVAWCVRHVPVKDWMSWNSVMRLAIPAFGVGCVLVWLLEMLSGGPGALGRMLNGAFLPVAGMILLLTGLGTWLALKLQGEELLDCVLDNKGAHVSAYLMNPDRWRLLARFRGPSLLERTDTGGDVPLLLLETRDLPWREVSRVQLWPQKDLILFYAPSWWNRLSVCATPFVWEDALAFIREKLGRKKNVALPAVLTAEPKARKSSAGTARKTARPANEKPGKKLEPPVLTGWPEAVDEPEAPAGSDETGTQSEPEAGNPTEWPKEPEVMKTPDLIDLAEAAAQDAAGNNEN